MTNNSHTQQFIQYLHGIVKHPGPAADLRRCLNKPAAQATRAHRYVAPFLNSDTHPAREEAFYTVASLLATHTNARPSQSGDEEPLLSPGDRKTNLGEWLGKRVATPSGPNPKTVESRLFRVARIDANDLRPRLHDLIRSGQPTPSAEIDWVSLLNDLSWWDTNENIAKQWVQGYFRACTPLMTPTIQPDDQPTQGTN